MASPDDGYREIQLSGKQIVFWFMAFVVIGVVVFLLGVQVGRGVLAQRGLPEGEASASAAEPEPAPPPASTSQGSGAPVTAGEKLSYAERLGSVEPPAEQLKVVPTPKPEAAQPVRSPAPPGRNPGTNSASKPATSARTADAAAPATSVPGEPAGSGYAIQVAALREREEADTIVKRLAGKGYPAYVVTPGTGAPSVFRVRVGKYKDRREADTVAAKLQKEEQFKPWVVR